MKTIILIGMAAVGLSATAKILQQPQLLPLSVWKTVPSTMGSELDANDVAEINRMFSKATPIGKRMLAEWRMQQASPMVAEVDESAPAAPRPVLLVQAAQAPVALPPLPPDAPEPPQAPEAPTPPPNPDQDDQSDITKQVAKDVARAKRDAERAQRDAERQLQLSTAAVRDMSNLHFKFAGAGQDQRSLVIRSSETDPKTMVTAEEDLNVMARILDRAAAKTGEGEDKKAMGVSLISFGSGVKNFQIEGFGAVFLLKVGFPLSGPPAKAAEEKPEQTTNSAWDEAKRELYGPREGTAATKWSTTRPTAARVAYDPKRVDELKDSLLEALKNASNMRALKESDSVTVVVTSGEAQGGPLVNEAIIVNGGTGGAFSAFNENWTEVRPGAEAGRPRSAVRTGSTLSIRVKKSDVDAFAKGKINLDEFRKRAAMVLY